MAHSQSTTGSSRLAICGLFVLSALAALLAACGNPRKDPEPQPADGSITREPVAPKLTAKLAPRCKQGQIFRVDRTLKVREQTANDIVVLEGLESSLSEVVSADEQGRALVLKRKIEKSLTRLGSEGGRIDETKNPLHGCTLELRRDAQGTASATVIEGSADIGKQKFLIDGFDAALLPLGEIREGDRWSVPADELDKPGGLNAMIAAQGFKIEKNELQVRVSELTEKRATLELDWQIIGSFGQAPAVMAFSGSLDFDREKELISRLSLDGGRTGPGGKFTRQITISVTRKRE